MKDLKISREQGWFVAAFFMAVILLFVGYLKWPTESFVDQFVEVTQTDSTSTSGVDVVVLLESKTIPSNLSSRFEFLKSREDYSRSTKARKDVHAELRWYVVHQFGAGFKTWNKEIHVWENGRWVKTVCTELDTSIHYFLVNKKDKVVYAVQANGVHNVSP